jgi:hypothetical protein
MITQPSHLGIPPLGTRQAGARLGRLAVVLAAAICGLLASAPSSLPPSREVPLQGGQHGPGPIRQVPDRA